MPIAQSLLAEFEAPAPVTRKFLERLPNNKLTWKPHPRSLTAGQLAYHLAFVPGGVVRGAQKSQIPPPDFQFPQPATVQEVLDAFDQSVATVREVLPGFDDATMSATWRIVAGDQEIAAMFCVYLRLLDVPVPSSWGPSADEGSVLHPEPQPA